MMSTETKERHDLAIVIFKAVLEADVDQRAMLLTRLCAGDEALQNEIETLLDAHREMGDFITKPLSGRAFELLAIEQKNVNEGRYDLKSGDQIGHFKIDRLLGKGGMGEVYLATDPRLTRPVALKLLASHLTVSQDFIERFEKEADVIANIDHPNIITIYEFEEEGGVYYMATEFVDGRTLGEIIQSPGMDLVEGLDIIIQTANALEALHAENLIHRDVKPSNVMVRSKDGVVKVLDFGLAKKLGGDFTEPGVIMGTRKYMSPEQCNGEKVDKRSDIFSLGVVLDEVIASAVTVKVKSGRNTLPTSSAQANELLAKLQRIIKKAQQEKPEDRYQDVAEVRRELEGLKQELKQGLSEKVPPKRAPVSNQMVAFFRRRPWVVAVAALLLAAPSVWLYKYIFPTVILTISGSDTIGNKMMPALVEDYFKSKNSGLFRKGPGNGNDSIMMKGIFQGEIFAKAIVIKSHGTNEAFQELQSGANDIGMASRQIRDDEQKQLGGNSAIDDYAIGHDGVAIIVNPANQIRNNQLTVEEVGKIFRREGITSWRKLDAGVPKCGDNINTYIRDDESGTRAFVKRVLQRVLFGVESEDASKEIFINPTRKFNDNGELVKAVSLDPCGIGFVPLPFTKNEEGQNVVRPIELVELVGNKKKVHKIDNFSLASNDYILARPLYLYARSTSTNGWIKDFASFCLSERGQNVVKNSDFVTLEPLLETVQTPLTDPEVPKEYRELERGAEKLSLYIPFQRGKSDFSPHAMRTIATAIQFFSKPKYKGRVVVVVGHGDDVGTESSTFKFSEARAHAVWQELRRAGINLGDPLSLGNKVPAVFYNPGEDQEKNRRVEFWLKK